MDNDTIIVVMKVVGAVLLIPPSICFGWFFYKISSLGFPRDESSATREE